MKLGELRKIIRVIRAIRVQDYASRNNKEFRVLQ